MNQSVHSIAFFTIINMRTGGAVEQLFGVKAMKLFLSSFLWIDSPRRSKYANCQWHRKLRLVLVFIASGFHQTSFAMAPDYVGIGQLFMYAIGIVGLIFVGLGASVAKNRAKGALVGAGIYVALLVGTFIWMSITSNLYNRGIEEMAADRKKVAERSVSVLRDRCNKEERFIVSKALALGSSIFINLYPESMSPTATSAPSVNQTPAMKEQLRKYGQSFPPSSNVDQYLRAISWISDAEQPETIAALIRTDLVDSRDRYKTYGKMYYRFATKQRWEKDGMSDVAIEYTEKYIDEYKFRNWPEGQFKQRIPIDKPTAQFVFTVEDISTMEDRNDWLARGRIRLLDAANSEIVAEYIGFQSLLQENVVCPNALKSAFKPTGKWDMLRFFFSRVTQQ